MLKLFSLPIAHLHSGGRHDETVGSSLVPFITHYYIAQIGTRQTRYQYYAN